MDILAPCLEIKTSLNSKLNNYFEENKFYFLLFPTMDHNRGGSTITSGNSRKYFYVLVTKCGFYLVAGAFDSSTPGFDSQYWKDSYKMPILVILSFIFH